MPIASPSCYTALATPDADSSQSGSTLLRIDGTSETTINPMPGPSTNSPGASGSELSRVPRMGGDQPDRGGAGACQQRDDRQGPAPEGRGRLLAPRMALAMMPAVRRSPAGTA